MDPIPDIVQRIAALAADRQTLLVAIDGCGGSGKSAFAAELARALGAASLRAEVVAFDEFFLPSELRPGGSPGERPIGGDFDWRRLRDQVLQPLRSGLAARYARYDWARDALLAERDIGPGAVVLVEGVYTSRRELAPLYHLRIWVDCPREVRLRRGLERDGEDGRARWELDWMPCEVRYVEEHRPHETADIVVRGGGG